MLKETDERALSLATALDSCFREILTRIDVLERNLGTRIEAMGQSMDQLEARMNKIESRLDSIETTLRGMKGSRGALIYSRETRAAM
jgi:hypothetical protein